LVGVIIRLLFHFDTQSRISSERILKLLESIRRTQSRIHGLEAVPAIVCRLKYFRICPNLRLRRAALGREDSNDHPVISTDVQFAANPKTGELLRRAGADDHFVFSPFKRSALNKLQLVSYLECGLLHSTKGNVGIGAAG